MSIETTHPEYGLKEDDWRQMRDTIAGQRTIKQATFLYLPATKGMVLDGVKTGAEPGLSSYYAYRDRAQFLELVSDAIQIMIGIMHREEAEILLPKEMEPLRANATRRGESLLTLLRRLNVNQLSYGRIGALADIAEGASLPHIVTYQAESITNWDDFRSVETDRDKLNFVVTSEDAWLRGAEGQAAFDWTQKTRYRVFQIGENGFYESFVKENDSSMEPVTPLFEGRSLDFVPFTFIGANDLESSPGIIPLLGLSNAALTIYRGDADYRQSIHMLGQDTLVLIGDMSAEDGDNPDSPTRIGAGSKIQLPVDGDAKFIGIDSNGVPEQRKSLSDDKKAAAAQGARLLENTGSQAESGEALRIRVTAKTTTLHSIALAGAAGLENTLKQIAQWIGADPEKVKVTANLDFVEDSATAEDIVKMMEAKFRGVPLSYESIHQWLQKNDVTNRTFDEEIAQIRKEEWDIGDLLQPKVPIELSESSDDDDDDETPDDENDENDPDGDNEDQDD